MAEIAVIGTGYVGLTTAIGLASLGHEVRAFDIDAKKVEQLKNGMLPIFEPGLDDLLKKVLASKNLTASSDLEETISNSEFVFTCVPTPQDEDGSADLSYVLAASKSMREFLRPNSIVITKSTVPVGSASRVENSINRKDVNVASNPEFLREGSAVQDFNFPDRIVVGARNADVGNRVLDLFAKIDAPKVLTSQPAAELIKYASNSFLAIKLSFVNDVAALCEAAGADPSEVMHGMGLDSRIGNRFLQPGPGWGGSCFPKDTRALSSIASDFGIQFPLISAAISSNETAHKRIVDRAMKALGGSLVDKTIAVLGITFKANTDDTRESPALAIIERLIGRGAKVQAYDPMVSEYNLAGLKVSNSPELAAQKSDALLVLTEWDEFRKINPEKLIKQMANKFVIDARNILDKKEWEKAGAIFPGLKD